MAAPFCTACGAAVADGTRFCVKCGQVVGQAAPPPPPPMKTPEETVFMPSAPHPIASQAVAPPPSPPAAPEARVWTPPPPPPPPPPMGNQPFVPQPVPAKGGSGAGIWIGLFGILLLVGGAGLWFYTTHLAHVSPEVAKAPPEVAQPTPTPVSTFVPAPTPTATTEVIPRNPDQATNPASPTPVPAEPPRNSPPPQQSPAQSPSQTRPQQAQTKPPVAVPDPGPAPTQPQRTATAHPTSGLLHAAVEVAQNGEVVFENLPAARLKFTFDHSAWRPTISRQANGTQTLVMRSLRPGIQTTCDVRWEIVE